MRVLAGRRSWKPWPGRTQHRYETEALDLGGGVSVLEIRKTSYAIDNRVVEVADIVLPGDRTQLAQGGGQAPLFVADL